MGVKSSFSLSGQHHFSLSLSTSLLTPVDPQGIQCSSPLLYFPLELPDMPGRAHFAKNAMPAICMLWSALQCAPAL